MDPSTSSAQEPQNQPASDQPMGRAQQPPATTTQPSQQTQQDAPAPQQQEHRTQISVGGVEAGVAIVQEDEANDAESVADIQENIALQPSGPETAINASPEVEKVIEKSPDLEKPDIPKVVSDAGVTQSGPGVIQVDDNSFGISQMPAITAQQAATQFKTTHLHDSKHWFVGMLIYIWKKLQTDKETETAVVNEMKEEEEASPQA